MISCPLLNASMEPQHKNPDVSLEPCRRNPPCKVDCCWLAKRVAKLLSQLSEPSNVTQSVTELNKFLATEKLNVCDVANLLLKQKSYSDEDMKFAFGLGKENASREVATQNQALEFFDVDGEPRWYDIVVFNRDNIGKLRKDWDKEFTADMVGKVIAYEPSPKQKQNILRIFVQLGGRCDPNVKARYF